MRDAGGGNLTRRDAAGLADMGYRQFDAYLAMRQHALVAYDRIMTLTGAAMADGVGRGRVTASAWTQAAIVWTTMVRRLADNAMTFSQGMVAPADPATYMSRQIAAGDRHLKILTESGSRFAALAADAFAAGVPGSRGGRSRDI